MALQTKKTSKAANKKNELDDFRKIHSDTFIYFLEEYDKWVKLKDKRNFETKE